jgi:hypothetical protein
MAHSPSAFSRNLIIEHHQFVMQLTQFTPVPGIKKSAPPWREIVFTGDQSCAP